MGALGISSVTEPTTTGTVKLISLPEEVIKKICEEVPYFSPATIPAKTYKGQTEPIHTLQSPNIMAVTEKLSDDLVYQMTKEIFTHKSDLENVAKVMSAMSANEVGQIKIPLHYFRRATDLCALQTGSGLLAPSLAAAMSLFSIRRSQGEQAMPRLMNLCLARSLSW